MSSVGDLLDGYDTIAAWDEMFDAAGGPRPHYRTLYEQVQTSSRADFDERCSTRDRVFRRDMKEIGTDWFRGKNAPGYLPTGPWLVPASEDPDTHDLAS